MPKTLKILVVVLCLVGGSVGSIRGQASLPIYTDHLVNGFQDWSWAPRDLGNTSTVHIGSAAIRVTASLYQGVAFYHSPFSAQVYSSVSLWAHGGSSGGQVLKLIARADGKDRTGYSLAALPANTWREYVVPLATLGVTATNHLERLTLQLAGGSTGTFYLDDLGLSPRTPPAVVQVTVNGARELRMVDARHFGVNTAVWDSHFEKPETVDLLREMGTLALRFPGGSLSDGYHWASGTTGTNTWKWTTSFADFAKVATNIGAEVFITVNYGTGTPEEAAAWVRHANVTNHFGFKYWEIGNENYGTWEEDANDSPHDAFTYATRARDYLSLMKGADPSIKIGMVVITGEDSYGYTNHPATNPRTGKSHNGWTPVLLSTLRSLGVKPDFVVYHYYPEWTGASSENCADSDPLLLQTASNWAADAADLRQQIEDYYGVKGADIELVCTENNSDAGAQGRQSTSLVNGLYYADSLGQLMKTELNAFLWWDLRNGTDRDGSMDATLYGWRDYGDLGMINGLTNRHPTFYAARLMRQFASPGDAVVEAAAAYPLIGAYAVRKTAGGLSLLLLNKDPEASMATDVVLAGFTPAARASFVSYGIPQDEAARTNGPISAQDLATGVLEGVSATNAWTLPPLSMTLVEFRPAGPTLSIVADEPPGTGRLALYLSGDLGATYVVEQSPDLAGWSPLSTNTITGSSVVVTNVLPVTNPQTFWRARLAE